MPASSRRAFTLVELLVVIAIIGTLVGLLLPAIQGARERARMVTCNNNQSQLAKAMQQYATKGKGVFPGWVQYKQLSSGDVAVFTWPAMILAELDEQGLRDQMLDSPAAFNYLQPPRLDVFICPSDVGTDPKQGRLTYSVNSGTYDRTTNGALPNNVNGDLKGNGVCHDMRPGRKGVQVRFGGGNDLRDGADSTILVGENVHKDIDNTWLGAFADPILSTMNVNDATTSVMTNNPEQRLGMVWIPILPPGPPSPNVLQPFNRDLRNPSPGTFSDLAVGSMFARPSGEHPDVFIVAFCGGNTREISENIEYRVYQQLMTPNGQKAGDPQDLSLNLKGYMVPPIGDGDY